MNNKSGEDNIGADILNGILNGNRRMLAKGITLVESHNKDDEEDAQKLLAGIASNTNTSIRLGITGAPGVGKSTFIENLGVSLIEQGHKIAVLAVDPSSTRSGGSILGDKTRMPNLSNRPEAFIRPSPTCGALGGVARKTYETMMLCEAAGYDIILVETVGVGQSEVEVASMVDYFLVLLLPNAGDFLQGMKKGIIEMADMLIINKADGDNIPAARLAKREYEQALSLILAKGEDIRLCSALTGQGISEVWNDVVAAFERRKADGSFIQLRLKQLSSRMISLAENALLQDFRHNDQVKRAVNEFKQQLENGEISPVTAGNRLLDIYWNSRD